MENIRSFKPDAIDKEILRALQRDGRQSNLSLARAVGLSPTPCQERVKRLEREGLILGYGARVDPLKIGLGMLVIVHVTLNHGDAAVFTRFEQALQDIPNVVECLMVTGSFDYILKVRVTDMQDYRNILNEKVSSIAGVAQTNTFVVIEETKMAPGLPIL